MTQQQHQLVNDALQSARQAHGVGETSDEIVASLDAVLAVCAENASHETAYVHYSLATHYMIRTKLDVAIEHCESGLLLVRGLNTQLEIDLLVLLSRQHLSNNVLKARELTTQAMSLSIEINGQPSPAVMLRHAEAVGAAGDTDEAIALLRQAEAMFELDGDPSGRLLTLNRLCVQLINSQQHALVIEYATEAIALAIDLNRRMAQLNAFKFLAMALTAVSKPAEAYEVAKRALDIAEAHYPGHLVGDCTGVLGDVYLQLKDLPTALSCFKRALSVYRETGHRNGVALCLLRIGEVYGMTGQTEQADRLLKEANDIANDIGNTVLHQSIAVVRAGLSMRSNNDTNKPPTEAIDKAVEMFRRIAGSSFLQPLPLLDEIEISFVLAPPTPVKVHEIEHLNDDTLVRVTMLGSFHVVRGGTEITLDEWKRKKARDVFKLLASRHRRSVSVDEIVLNVWGDDLDAERCLPTLQNAVSAIRTALEPDLKPRQKSQYLQFIDGSYMLDLGLRSVVDIHEFSAAATQALSFTNLQQRLDALTRAADLYRGHFLPDDTYYDWTDFLRSTTRELAIEVLDQLASTQFALGMDSAARITMHRSASLDTN